MTNALTTSTAAPAAEAAEVAPVSTLPMVAPSDALSVLASEGGPMTALVASWQRNRVDSQAVAAAQSAVRAALKGTDGHLIDDFDKGLPASVRAAALDMLSTLPIAVARPATKEQLAALTAAEGGVLVAEWGAEAPMRLGKARAFFQNLVSLLTPADKAAAIEWLEAQPPQNFRAIMRAVAR